MDMLKIQHKLRSEEYDEIDQLTADIELLIENTKAYYIVSSLVCFSDNTDVALIPTISENRLASSKNYWAPFAWLQSHTLVGIVSQTFRIRKLSRVTT